MAPQTSASGADPINIGVVTALSHPAGEQGYQAVQIAVDEINSRGGVKVGGEKRLLKAIPSDTRDAEPGVPVTDALLALEKTILEKKVSAVVVGPLRSEVFLAAMDIVAKYKIPMLVAIAMTPDSEPKFKENPEKYKYVFRLCVSSKHLMMYLSGVMGFINEQFGFNKVHIFNQDVAWARAVAGLMSKVYFEKAGWTILGQENYPAGTGDFSTGLMKAQSGGAQVIMPIFDMVETNVLIKQWKSMRVNALMAGFTSRMGIPEAWKNCDGKIGGAMEAIYELGSGIGSAKVPGSMEFQTAFEKRWKGYPSGTGGHGPGPAYESVKILAEAIERAGTVNADDVVAQLEKTDRMGIFGRIRFDSVHQVPYGLDYRETATGGVIQWTDAGKRVIVYPPALAEAKIELPKGMKSAK
ncbi:MAG: amino acid ABC transporter substrate-binding protein [Deltaproteobacteria bacterium HGW-Deltaproteobacteria-21]|nr:MAG: amino acid ABC transporter substrate-binding protein [Deltaproteobacteria bacterium HGW-Deltaproteobacteria-21]